MSLIEENEGEEEDQFTPQGISNEDIQHASARARERAKHLIQTAYKDFSILGFFAFFYILEKLMILFFILTLFAYATMGIYFYYGENKYSIGLFDYVEMGNLGYSSSHCKDIALGVGRMALE